MSNNHINHCIQPVHTPRSADAYAVSTSALHLRLQVGANEAKRVLVIFGDPFNWNVRIEKTMELSLSNWYYDWFETEVSLSHGRYAYYFVIETLHGSWQYGEMGLSSTIDPGKHAEHCFHYQYLNESEVFLPPDWVQDSLFYLVFPDRFRRDDGKWGFSSGDGTAHMGGTLQGIINSIDYLKQLGVSAIYFTPIFTAQSYHRYDTIDYYQIDPILGTKEDLRQLVNTAHKAGMRIILDAVFNHCGSNFPQFQDVVKRGKASPYWSWFYVNRFPIEFEKRVRLIHELGWEGWVEHEEGFAALEYETFAFTPFMPRLRSTNPEVQQYLLDVVSYWIREFDIDGWRLDVADEVSPDFWRAFRKAVKAEKHDAYIVAEVWYDSRFWLDGTQFDAVMNYPVNKACTDFFALRNISASKLRSQLSASLMRYSWPVNRVMMNLFESHDTDRFLSLVNGDASALILAYCFVLTFPGTPLLFYGSEVGMHGKLPHENRQPMEWDSASWNKDILSSVQNLTQLRRRSRALRRGTFNWVEHRNEDIVAFYRCFENERVLICMNRGNEAVSIPLGPGKWRSSRGAEVLGEFLHVPAVGYDIAFSNIHINDI